MKKEALVRRVVDRGVNLPLQVFWTSTGKGWGVRSEAAIPVGAFVAAYIGEVMTSSEGNQTTDHSYLFDLDHFVKVIGDVKQEGPANKVRRN